VVVVVASVRRATRDHKANRDCRALPAYLERQPGSAPKDLPENRAQPANPDRPAHPESPDQPARPGSRACKAHPERPL